VEIQNTKLDHEAHKSRRLVAKSTVLLSSM